MSLIGSLAVSILGDDRELKKAFGSTEKQINRLEKKMYKTARSIGDMGKSMTTLITGPVVALGAGMFGLAEKTAAAGDEVQKMALRTGFSTEALSEFKHAAELSGTSLDGLENGVRRMQRSVLDLERGLATQTEAFAMLGLEIEDIQGLSPEQQFEKITMALADVEDESKQAALAQQIFGRSGTQLLPMLKQGSDGIREMREEAQELGIVFDQEAADQAAEFQDELTRLKAEFTGFIQQLGMELIPLFLNDLIPMFKETVFPVIRDLTEKVKGIIAWFSGLDTGMQKNIIKWTLLAAAIGPVLIIISKMIMVAKTFLPILKAIKIAMAAINAPTLAIVAAIGALIAVTVELVRNWQETKDAIVAVWDYLKASVNHLVISIQLAFEHMKWAVLAAVNFMLEKLSILENIPYIGEKFKDLKNMISDGVDGSAEKIAELQKKAKESGDKLMDSFGEVGSSFGKLGGAIVDDVKGMVGGLLGFGKAVNDTGEDTEELGADFKNLDDDISDTGNSLAFLNNNLDDTGENTRTVTDITDEMQEKLQQVNNEIAVFGDEIDENSRKSKIYRDAIVELIKQFGPNHEKVRALIKEYEKYKKAIDDSTKSTFDMEKVLDEMDKSLGIAEKQSVAFGDSFDLNSEKARILKNTILKLIKNGIDPNSEKVQELIDKYNELTEVSDEVEKSTFNLDKVMKSYQNKLTVLENKNKIFGDSFDLASEKANLMQRTINTLIENGISPASPQVANLKAELDKLKGSMKDVDNQTLNTSTIFGAFKNNVVNWMGELRTNTAAASMAMSESIVGFVDSITSGQKTLKEALKEITISFLTMLEKQVIATQIAEVAKAEMESFLTFGATLAAIPGILAAAAPALATFETLKAGIRALATGGIVQDAVLAMVGEGKDNEAVLPLNAKTFAGLAEGIVNQLSRMQMTPATAGAGAAGRISNVENNSQPTYNFYFPHAIDKAGTKRFVRNEVIPIITSENIRKGGN